MIKIKFEFTKTRSREDKLLEKVKEATESGGWEAAKEVCRNTRGKSAFVLYKFIDTVIQKNEYED